MPLDLAFVVFALALFLAVVLLLEGAWNLWVSRHSPAARRRLERLSSVAERAPTREGTAAGSGLLGEPTEAASWWARTAPGQRLQAWLRSSGSRASVAQMLRDTLLAAALAGLAAALSPLPPLLVPVLVAVAAAAPWAWLKWRRDARCRRIEAQFPQALDLLSRALRAGHALPAAVRMAAEELPDPLVRDFRLLFEEMNYGVAVPQALSRFAARVPLPDAGYFAVAVNLQRESGGNLAEVLDKIASLVRDRLRLRGEVRTLSAEGRLSAVILTALPFGVALVVQTVNPRFLSVLWTDPAGRRLVALALVGIVLGVLWMRSIIRIRV